MSVELCFPGIMNKVAANLVVLNFGVYATSDVTSSGPVKLADLQRILSNIEPAADSILDPDEGFELGDILKPDLILPLMETLPLEQRLASYLPEKTMWLSIFYMCIPGGYAIGYVYGGVVVFGKWENS